MSNKAYCDIPQKTTTDVNDNYTELKCLRWAKLSNLTEKRGGGTAVAIDNDRILLVGGSDGNCSASPYISSGEMYDMRDDSWTPLNSNMPTNRYGCSGVFLSGKVYIIGGFGTGNSLNSMDVFNAITHEWEKTIQMQSKRNYCGTMAYGKHIYIFGGTYTKDSVERFNIDTEVWDTLPSMPRARNTCCAVMIGKKIYLLGGKYQTAVDVFDLNSMAWDNDDNRVEAMSTVRNGCCAVSVGHYILTVGGYNDGGTLLNSTELLNTESNKWTTLPSYMTSCPAVAVVNTTHVVVAGGNTGSQYLNEVIKADFSSLMSTSSRYNQVSETGNFSKVSEGVTTIFTGEHDESHHLNTVSNRTSTTRNDNGRIDNAVRVPIGGDMILDGQVVVQGALRCRTR